LHEQVFVEGFPAIEYCAQTEMVQDELPSIAAEGVALALRHLHDPRHCCAQGKGASSYGQEAGLAIDEGLVRSGHIGGDGWQGTGGGFEKPHGKAFPE